MSNHNRYARKRMRVSKGKFRRSLLLLFLTTHASAQQTSLASQTSSPGDLAEQVIQLRALVLKLQSRVDELESRTHTLNVEPAKAPTADKPAEPPASQETPRNPPLTESGLLEGTTFNLSLDGYYGYNFNHPIGRDNLLRAYDVVTDAFSLNQASVVIENAPDVSHGKRYGGRLDLQWGQATQTLQGNLANEPRPEIYRAIFQAYGTYVLPVGRGLTLDAGKWSSSLGIEGNYTKDQMNYSRSFWFSFLPFYHTGLRANYKFNDVIAMNYWITNGTQQTEPFNGFKDQLVGLTLQPHKSVTWTLNYYFGQEHPDTIYYAAANSSNTPANLPTIQGVPFQPIVNAPNGRLHILDTYVAWQASPKLSLAAEADYVTQRPLRSSAPARVTGGAAYLRYQLFPAFALAGRGELLSDRGGMFSGTTQSLKETTFTAEYKFAEGFLARGEWRRDFSNQAYFLTSNLGVLKKEQNSATLGLVWWFGKKQGSW